MKTVKKIVLLFQTPPPFHGQAIMLNWLVRQRWRWCDKVHIRLHYSDKINEVGRFSFKKMLKWLEIVAAVIKERIRGKIDIMAYSPAPPRRVPFYRDVLIIPLLRLCGKKIVFHFHSAGFDEFSQKLFFWEKLFAKKIYWQPDLAIVLSAQHKKEIEWIEPRAIAVIPNGTPDCYRGDKARRRTVTILSVGLISREKGALVSLEAAKRLKESGINFRWIFAGLYENKKFKEEVANRIVRMGLTDMVKFVGEVRGGWKWRLFRQADIVCHPTFYRYEVAPVVLIESMMMGRPIVATKWQYIPEMISSGEEGYLVPTKNYVTLVKRLATLIESNILRREMGRKGRQRYLNEFTLKRHLGLMEKAYKELANEPQTYEKKK